MKANGIDVALNGNKGFTLPSNIGELGDDITKLDLFNCSVTGLLSTRVLSSLPSRLQLAMLSSLRFVRAPHSDGIPPVNL